ncbi:MAG: hypothetical protein RL685_1143 [Pseudomonadota bacterium]|jgi:hypothetical protein
MQQQLQRLREWLAPRSSLLGWAAILAIVVCFQGRALLDSVQYTFSSPLRLSDDARQQIFPFFRYIDPPSALDSDYVASYYLACYPLGYWTLYAGSATLGLDPTTLSHALPHVLWLLTAAGLAAVAHRLAGKLSALCTLALCLGSDAYLTRMGGGLPRSFGFPVLTLALVGLAYARERVCVAAVLLGALFYPVTGVIAGLALTAGLLLPQRTGCSVSSRSLRGQLVLLAATAAVSIAVLIPSLLGSRHYGSAVRPAELAEFPEVGPGGRYGSDSRPPFKGFLHSIPDAVAPALLAAEAPWSPAARSWLVAAPAQPWESPNYRRVMWALLVLVLVGGTRLLLREPAARRVALLGVASAIGYSAAVVAMPYAYLPERYSVYTGALLGTLAVSASVTGLLPMGFQTGARRRLGLGLLAAHVALLLSLFAGRVPESSGVKVDLTPSKPLLDAIAALPPQAFIAAWPRGLTNGIPYASRRSVLVTFETHQAFHRDFIEEMRQRMRALIDAYFATSLEPIVRLRDEYGVTHLLIERAHFRGRSPFYFKPFDGWLSAALRAARGKRYELPRQIAAASIYSFGDFELLDLSRLH